MASYLTGFDQIPIFDGQNYQLWKFRVKLFFEVHKMMKIVDGTEKCHLSSTPNVETWKDKDAAARFCLASKVEPSCLRSLLGCKTSAEMWTRLNTYYQPDDSQTIFRLGNQFMMYKHEPGHCVMDHISTLEAMYIQLNEAGCSWITEETLLKKIIETLPGKNLRVFVLTRWSSLSNAERTIEALTKTAIEGEVFEREGLLNFIT